MKAKVILVDPFSNETLVATVKSNVEAFQFASLLQSLVNTPNYIYYVEYHVKGKGLRRSQPDGFSNVVNNSINLQNYLKNH